MKYVYGQSKSRPSPSKPKRSASMDIEPRSQEDFEIRVGMLENRVEDLEKKLEHQHSELIRANLESKTQKMALDEMGKTVRRIDLMVGQILSKGAAK